MEIKLSKGIGTVKISPEDYDVLSKYKWNKNSNGYIYGWVNGKMILMHRYITKPIDNEKVDHINGDRTDNRRENLRNTTTQKNNENRSKKKNTSNEYYGVFLSKNKKKYGVQITINKKTTYLGYFENEINAAERRDMYIVHNKLDHMKLNFPEKKEEYMNKEYIQKISNPKTNKYFGVYKQKNRFQSKLKLNKTQVNLGSFKTAIDAAIFYDKYIVDNKIKGKQLNFPENYPTYDVKEIKIMCKEIDDLTVQLLIKNNDEIILIDKTDYDTVKYYTCCVSNGYVCITSNNQIIKLHRFLMNVIDPNVFIDHIDRNPLNNKRNNLRLSNAQKNAQNRGKIREKTASSKYIGIRYVKSDNVWRGVINKDNKTIYDIKDKDEILSAIRRDLYILKELKDDNYTLNFIWTIKEIEEWTIKIDNTQSSKYIGVYYSKHEKKWRVQISKNKKCIYNEAFDNEIYAARKRDIFILENNYNKKLNFKWTNSDIIHWKTIIKN